MFQFYPENPAQVIFGEAIDVSHMERILVIMFLCGVLCMCTQPDGADYSSSYEGRILRRGGGGLSEQY
mgnify:CR=1 FL=1